MLVCRDESITNWKTLCFIKLKIYFVEKLFYEMKRWLKKLIMYYIIWETDYVYLQELTLLHIDVMEVSGNMGNMILYASFIINLYRSESNSKLYFTCFAIAPKTKKNIMNISILYYGKKLCETRWAITMSAIVR